jgi:hypothetical protein
MKIIGFNFSKIHAEKSDKAFEKINIKTNIDISEITEVKSDIFDKKESLVGTRFEFKVDYEPEYAQISFNGFVLFSLEKKEADEVLKLWKDKKISENFKVVLFNAILKKSNLKALQLEEELNLPLHIPLPSVKSTK